MSGCCMQIVSIERQRIDRLIVEWTLQPVRRQTFVSVPLNQCFIFLHIIYLKYGQGRLSDFSEFFVCCEDQHLNNTM